MKEIWKDIEDYEGLYQVSNLGRIKSLPRKFVKKSIILKAKKDRRKYCRVILSKNSVPKTFLIHRLVAKAFILNKNNKPYINHLDENPMNNKITNLEWCTNGENLKYKNCLKKAKRLKQGKEIGQYKQDGAFVKKYISMTEAEEITKIKNCNIRSCCKGRSKTAGGFVWKYL